MCHRNAHTVISDCEMLKNRITDCLVVSSRQCASQPLSAWQAVVQGGCEQRRSIVAGRVTTAGSAFQTSRRSRSAGVRSECTRRRSVVKRRKLKLESGQPKRLPVVLASSVIVNATCSGDAFGKRRRDGQFVFCLMSPSPLSRVERRRTRGIQETMRVHKRGGSCAVVRGCCRRRSSEGVFLRAVARVQRESERVARLERFPAELGLGEALVVALQP
ncbi:unnamed protein product [Ixodes pacificus]